MKKLVLIFPVGEKKSGLGIRLFSLSHQKINIMFSYSIKINFLSFHFQDLFLEKEPSPNYPPASCNIISP
ncbi:hypothetical protein DMI80_01330 [Akkermansia muciniphila]|nr:hypothetical protein DMI79_01325 [Akkermansia muciniphila]QHV69559.1 hypothetical protein DMI80_01330 [Akkermansia muciniphila]QHV72013.1 hypothetical protein DMI81_01330 [Akkermansia muciniphila]